MVRLILKSSWMKKPRYRTVGNRKGVVWAEESLSRAPNSIVAHGSPFERVFGLMNVSAVSARLKRKSKYLGLAEKTRRKRHSPPVLMYCRPTCFEIFPDRE